MNNRFPQIHLVYDRCKRASSSKKAAVEIRITHNYKRKYITTGIMLYPNQWRNGRIENCEDVVKISKILDRLISNVRQVLLDMVEEGNLDIMAISDRLDEMDRKTLTFIDFCHQRATIRKYGKEKDTQERYDRFLRLFIKWGKIRTFEDIREEKIIAYDKFLAKSGMRPYSKWNNYHRFLSGFIQDAIDAGYMSKNPYKWVNIAKEKDSCGIDRCLTPHEFRMIKNSRMPTESLSRVRDVFVFQTYTCLRYSDLARFDARLIKEIKGMKVYIRASKKTRKPFTVPILSPAWDILMKYDGQLPIISNVKYNLYLKNVAQAAGLDIKLTTHWARHTGATLLINEGLDTKYITKICGHSSTRITEQIYAKLLDETVVEAVQEIAGNL